MSSPDQRPPGSNVPGGGGGVPLITSEVLEAYLNCKYKGYLKLAGQTGTPSDYEVLMKEIRAETIKKAEVKLAARYGGEPLRGVRIDFACLKRGAPLILDGLIEGDGLSLRVNGLIRIDEPSRLGDFQYAPLLIHEREKIEPEQRRLLAILGLLIGDVQGKQPSHGFIVRSRSLKIGKIEFNVRSRSVRRLLDEIRGLAAANSPPRLILNDHCQVCEFRRACEQRAISEDNLSLLRGLGEKGVKSYSRRGVFTITQLAHTFRPRRKSTSPHRVVTRRNHALTALALKENTIYIFAETQALPSGVSVYLDIKSNPEESYVYLIGMVITGQGEERRRSFWADGKDEEDVIFDLFLDELELLGEFSLYCYGSFEKNFLSRMRKRSSRPELVDRVMGSLVNVLSIVYNHFYFPSYSNGLKDIARCLRFEWSAPDASALQSIVWRLRWEAIVDPALKQKLLQYNMDDCLALRRVAAFIRSSALETARGEAEPGRDEIKVAKLQDLERLLNLKAWGPARFAQGEFKFIAGCSYFNYQRDHVYVRTSRILKRHRPTSRRQRRNRTLRPNRDYFVVELRCPYCSGTDIEFSSEKGRPGQPRVKRAFDLAITSSGIRRRVVQTHSAVHFCKSCGRSFVPRAHRQLDNHFHNLKSFVIYLYVAHNLGFRVIPELVKELFGLTIFVQDVMTFRNLLAGMYEATANQIISKLVSGKFMHIDETEINLKTGKCFVWVFASAEEVFYMYRPNREGGFLRDLLSDFRGVLVTDFYSAYDSLDCPQQKCLIHLMRDMNQDLLNNPFDEDLRAITRPFGALLRSLVSTVDQHGLRQCHLKKHEEEVADLHRSLLDLSISSDAAEALRDRLLRCWDRLFTFIRHDGVSWNNTCAEHAIKKFGRFREEAARGLKEEGLKEYLILLSIYETCRYRGLSFHKFLRSKELDLETYRETKRPRRQPCTIETYPDGYLPSHIATLRSRKTVAPEKGRVESVLDHVDDLDLGQGQSASE